MHHAAPAGGHPERRAGFGHDRGAAHAVAGCQIAHRMELGAYGA
jgi:hypothetical protein